MRATSRPEGEAVPALLSVASLAFCRGGETVFSDVSFEADAGEVLQIHGANGSGKTTLLRLLAGLLRPAAGTISWHGADTRRQPETWRRTLAYVGHANAVSRDLTVIENLRFAARLGAASAHDASAACPEREALGRLGLAGCENRLAGALSQGQQRRIAMARLLIDRKLLWLLDEPAAALDAESTRLIGACIGEHVEHGGIAVMTTHRPIETAPDATRYFCFERTASCLI
ncbi:cytochrome c biogenesis heme-transporting ATPase CcmA [Paraburkholderia saeva]|uniref:Cytochrome c biogenesis ATP-binding export protein CcmA n=1 Tax=Paraburkholderia saeva TaxID=2777537 RepID=A0A9N8X1L4_9BURK|nr:cytochrome c biogenesis heme-transporting ATPase CcmA [Paraburkholderia saeva]CAG4888221.1 Cytochrome c biogenesis ATP-binding export protein CcmA [Paraburkholderia saeva]CAG4895464.1 Cytochrome c biogenesis ATP-binding export protein CcmA [Paraburkholderia saeva]CAG4897346.1 Cytochrome c biogenesis ATP-binding export protein CcmA [Paraburkholderia saeva]